MHRNNNLFKDQLAAATFSYGCMCCTKQLLGFNVTTVQGRKDKCALPRARQRTDRHGLAHPNPNTVGSPKFLAVFDLILTLCKFLMSVIKMRTRNGTEIWSRTENRKSVKAHNDIFIRIHFLHVCCTCLFLSSLCPSPLPAISRMVHPHQPGSAKGFLLLLLLQSSGCGFL